MHCHGGPGMLSLLHLFAPRWTCQWRLPVSSAIPRPTSLQSEGIHQEGQKELRGDLFVNSNMMGGTTGSTRQDLLIHTTLRIQGGKARMDKSSHHLEFPHTRSRGALILNSFCKLKWGWLGRGKACCWSYTTSKYGGGDRSSGLGSGDGTLKRRPPVPDLARNYEVLVKELSNFIAEHGRAGIMPMRYELREHGRVDLEKAIARMGGSPKVAEQMHLSLAYKQRKPKGYWDELDNISREITLFQDERGMDSKIMPTRRSLEKAGRYDLARALEKWGGLQEVAGHLGLHVRWATKRRAQQQQLRALDDVSNQAVANSSSESANTVFNLPVKTALPPKSTKWLTIQMD